MASTIGSAMPRLTLPVRQRALRIGIDQPHLVPGILGGKRKPDRQSALAAAALLGGQNNRVHSSTRSLTGRPVDIAELKVHRIPDAERFRRWALRANRKISNEG